MRRLRAFVVLADERHFTRAASRLFVSQQSLSKQIAELEKAIGTPLFDRTSRRVELTAAGEAFRNCALETLDRFDRGVDEARRIGDGSDSVLRVGFVAGAALELTTHILSEFTARNPSVQLELREFSLVDPSAGLLGNTTDVAFLRLPATTDGLVTRILFTEPCVVGVSVRHPLNGRERVAVDDLLREPIAIGSTDDQAWRDYWTLASRRPEGESQRVVETTSQGEEMEVVSAGMACTITPAAARRYSPRPGVQFIPIEDYPGSVVAVARRAGAASPLVTAFVDTALTVRDREAHVVQSIERGQAP